MWCFFVSRCTFSTCLPRTCHSISILAAARLAPAPLLHSMSVSNGRPLAVANSFRQPSRWDAADQGAENGAGGTSGNRMIGGGHAAENAGEAPPCSDPTADRCCGTAPTRDGGWSAPHAIHVFLRAWRRSSRRDRSRSQDRDRDERRRRSRSKERRQGSGSPTAANRQQRRASPPPCSPSLDGKATARAEMEAKARALREEERRK